MIWGLGDGARKRAPRACALADGYPPRLGLCYQFYHFWFYRFGPDSYVIGPISFVPISYQQGSQGPHPTFSVFGKVIGSQRRCEEACAEGLCSGRRVPAPPAGIRCRDRFQACSSELSIPGMLSAVVPLLNLRMQRLYIGCQG